MKKISILLLTLLMIVSLFPIAAANTDPMIIINGSEEIKVYSAGEKGVLSIPIKNIATNYAENMIVTLTGAHPFRSDISTLTKRVTRLNPNEEVVVDLNVEVSPLAESKIYKFDVKFEYTDVYNGPHTVTREMYVKIENKNIQPIIGIQAVKTGSSVIKPNTEDAISINFSNSGTVTAKDVVVKISGFGIDNIMLKNDVDTKKIFEIKPNGSELIYFNVISAPKAKTGVYPYNLEISYIDEFGGTYKRNFEIYVSVEGSDTSSASVEISNIKYPKSIAPKVPFEVTCDVKNNSTIVIDVAEISIEYPGEFIALANTKKIAKKMQPNETQSMTFKLMAKDEAVTESYSGYINVKYVANGESMEKATLIQEYVGFNIKGKEGSSKPKLIIENYEYGGEYVLAGEPYELKLFIKNTSTSESTKNIKVTLSSEENVFTPVDSSSSFFIDQIRPGQVYEHVIWLKTKIDASVKIYSLTAKMEYEDGKGNAYDANKTPYVESESLSVAIAQPVRLETADAIVPYEVYVGQPFYIEQEFYNMGKSIMYNMMAKLEGPESNEGSYFVGNFEAGRSEYFSAQATAYEEGSFEGKLIYTFEDALGTVSTHEVPFSYTVVAAQNLGFEEGMKDGMNESFPVEEPKGQSLLSKIITGVIALAVVVGVALMMRRRKKRKLAAELEALDE